MLVLALDTATTAMTAGIVELDTTPGATSAPTVRAARVGEGGRTHAEHLAPWIAAVTAEAGATLPDLDAVVCGVGPGPFTGLRVGMVTASALGDALGLPVHGVCTHDALGLAARGRVLAVTDARRREVYWTVSVDGVRTAGPGVARPDDLAADLRRPHPGTTFDGTTFDGTGLDGTTLDVVVGDAAGTLGALTGVPARPPAGPSAELLAAVAADDLRAGRAPAPLRPLYLRRPDAVPPGAPKTVSRPA